MLFAVLFHGKLKLMFLLIKYCAHMSTANSDVIHAMHEPIAFKYGTRIMLRIIPKMAPMIELMSNILSFLKGIRICMIRICSYPIMKSSGISILVGRYAPSYPFPDNKLIMSGLNMHPMIMLGMEKANSVFIDCLMNLLTSCLSLYASILLICGIATFVHAV